MGGKNIEFYFFFKFYPDFQSPPHKLDIVNVNGRYFLYINTGSGELRYLDVAQFKKYASAFMYRHTLLKSARRDIARLEQMLTPRGERRKDKKLKKLKVKLPFLKDYEKSFVLCLSWTVITIF